MSNASSFTESRSVAYSDLHSGGVRTAQGTATGFSTISVCIIGLPAQPPNELANRTRAGIANMDVKIKRRSGVMNQTLQISRKTSITRARIHALVVLAAGSNVFSLLSLNRFALVLGCDCRQ